MVAIIVFIVLILFTASMTVLLYTRPRYRHVAIPTDELEEMLDEQRDI